VSLKYEWDAQKAKLNLEKHDVSYEEAQSVFKNVLAVIFDDEQHSTEEKREIIIGFLIKGRLLLVIFTQKSDELVRIISAREANRKESGHYAEQFKN
jgi:uncharacterized protein